MRLVCASFSTATPLMRNAPLIKSQLTAPHKDQQFLQKHITEDNSIVRKLRGTYLGNTVRLKNT
jgi:hypothetical protein